MTEYTADPDSVLDYSVDWTAWLADGETLTASAWTVAAGITQTAPSPSFTAAGVATVWLTGGTPGREYVITNHVTTSTGRQHDESIRISVTDL